MSIFAVPNKREINNRGVAQLASASGLGPEGPVFESQYPDNIKNDYLKSSGRFLLLPIYAKKAQRKKYCFV